MLCSLLKFLRRIYFVEGRDSPLCTETTPSPRLGGELGLGVEGRVGRSWSDGDRAVASRWCGGERGAKLWTVLWTRNCGACIEKGITCVECVDAGRCHVYLKCPLVGWGI